MSEPLRLLMIEDSATDAGLITRQLVKGGYLPQLLRVETQEEFSAALTENPWQIILCDYNLPAFSAPQALTLLRGSGRDIPCIVVSGFVGEETAVSLMKGGAVDFVLKDNLSRLVPAVQREIREAEVRRQNRRNGERLRLLDEISLALSRNFRDYREGVELAARHSAETIGDLCLISLLSEDGQWLDPVALYHPDPTVRQELRDCLTAHPFPVNRGSCGQVATTGQQLLITDFSPEEARHAMNPDQLPQLDRLGIGSLLIVPLSTHGQIIGTFWLAGIIPGKTINPDDFPFVQELANRVAISVDNANLYTDLQRSNLNLKVAYDTTLEGWSRALDLRDRETEGHSRRVTSLTDLLARQAGMTETEVLQAHRGALLHDIGKMGVPDAILHKSGTLTEEEWRIMRRHPGHALDLLWPIEYLRPALDIPYCHHERWDGSGYPRGLKGEEIPVAARLFAIVDNWDALRSDRPYRQKWGEEQILEYLRAKSGILFDPQAVELFIRFIGNRTNVD